MDNQSDTSNFFFKLVNYFFQKTNLGAKNVGRNGLDFSESCSIYFQTRSMAYRLTDFYTKVRLFDNLSAIFKADDVSFHLVN